MIKRQIEPFLRELLDESPAVTLLGPRQVGKTTLAKDIANEFDAVYLDLESQSDLAKLTDAELTSLRSNINWSFWTRYSESPSFP